MVGFWNAPKANHATDFSLQLMTGKLERRLQPAKSLAGKNSPSHQLLEQLKGLIVGRVSLQFGSQLGDGFLSQALFCQSDSQIVVDIGHVGEEFCQPPQDIKGFFNLP
jgi:hypothetical protein